MTTKQLEETLTALTAKAKALRDAGVTRVAIGDIELELAAPEPPEPPAPQQDEDGEDEAEGRGNPLDDADTYGGHVPRRKRVLENDERE